MKFTLCKKQYIYLILAAVSVCLALVTRVSAQGPENTGSQLREEVQERIEERVEQNEEAQMMRQQNREEIRNQLSEQLQNRIINLSANVTNRMQAVIDRFSNIALRLESRMDKLDAEGIDTVAARAILQEAKASLTRAQSMLDTIPGIANQVGSSPTPRELFQGLRAQFSLIQGELRGAHALLRETLAALKATVQNSPDETGVSDAVRNENSVNESNDSESGETSGETLE